jgi:hypothetical protein
MHTTYSNTIEIENWALQNSMGERAEISEHWNWM